MSETTTRRRTRGGDEAARALLLWDGGAAEVTLASTDTLTIGRGRACRLRATHQSVSREHARLYATPLRIEDLGSANGTRVNGVELSPRQITPIAPGSLVELGDAVLVVRLPPGSAEAERAARCGPPAGGMERVFLLVDRIAQGSIPVTFTGETGVGKELMAERVHAHSRRAAQPFLRINCAALPETLLESELFGHERGAFTGAVKPKPGLLEVAHGGTVFLDEVGELPGATQAKLLRALECREVVRLGSLKPRAFDVRFVAATNRDLDAMVAEGRFRADLFYRLGGVVVQVPPLRERRDEIEALAAKFVSDAAYDLGRPPPTWSRSAMQVLLEYGWPGNVRELKHVAECSLLVATGNVIERQHLPDRVTQARSAQVESGRSLRLELEHVERGRIIDALERSGGNQTRAARLLGMPRRTLVERINAYGLPRPRKRREDADRGT